MKHRSKHSQANRWRRELARSLHSRAYAKGGRLFLVSGQPRYSRLKKHLVRTSAARPKAQTRTLEHWGFARSDITELSAVALDSRRCAIEKWAESLAQQQQQPNLKPHDRRCIAAEQKEVNRLRTRVIDLANWLAAAPQEDGGETLILNWQDEKWLAATLCDDQGELSKNMQWQARVVFWLAGRTAATRFIQAVAPFRRSAKMHKTIDQFKQFRQNLYQWKRRIRTQSTSALCEILREAVRELPQPTAKKAKLTSRLRGRSFAKHCDMLALRVYNYLSLQCEPAMRYAAATIAAVVASDNATAAIPEGMVLTALEGNYQNAIDGTLGRLIHHAHQPKYNKMLQVLPRLDQPVSFREARAIRKLLVRNASLDDIAWVRKFGILEWFGDQSVPIRWLRSFVGKLKQAGIDLKIDQMQFVIESAKRRRDLAAFDRFAGWLGRFSKKTFSPRTKNLCWKVLKDLFVPAMRSFRVYDQLHHWCKPWMTTAPRTNQSAEPLESCLRPHADWLEIVGRYQQMVGKKVAVPKSLAKFTKFTDSRLRERDFLRTRVAIGAITEKQANRLAYLEDPANRVDPVSPAKLQRAIEETCLKAAYDALRYVVANECRKQWRSVAGRPLPQCSFTRSMEFATWAVKMQVSEAELLREILTVATKHKSAYRWKLPKNREWISKAKNNGLNWQAWTQPAPCNTTVDNRNVVIEVVNDPIEIFQMGSYFNTCLSLGGCNELSVLANAHDANKHVIFMRDARNHVVARQLVAVSEKFELLGYHCYSAVNHREPENHEKHIAAIASFCGNWARQCGLALGDDGLPETIGEHFWYDDGAHDWHNNARESWKSAGKTTPVIPQVVPADGSPAILA